MSFETEILSLAERTRTASEALGSMTTQVKNDWLMRSAELLGAARDEIREANERDMQAARENGVPEPMVNRLGLSDAKWADMIQGLHDVAALQDPVGVISDFNVRPNGLRVGRMAIPLGVICMIYEARPNVTVDAAALCVKAGNGVILRGGSEAFHSNQALGRVLRQAADEVGLPADAITLLPTTDRAAIDVLLKARQFIDMVIPRGGSALIEKVMAESTIPVVAHDAGICHVFLDATADPEMSKSIVGQSKIRQMPVCNGLETLLCHVDATTTVLPGVLKMLHEEGIEIRGDERVCDVFSEAKPASDEDWGTEYLAPILAVRVVDDLSEAVDHIRTYGSDHTDIIITNDYSNSQEWLRRVQSSCVGVNCSTGFADGFQLGLGAEIGISTSRLHAYGPMGLEGLTTRKFVLLGDGQIRE